MSLAGKSRCDDGLISSRPKGHLDSGHVAPWTPTTTVSPCAAATLTTYDYLVVAAGIQDLTGKNPRPPGERWVSPAPACSNYSYETVASTWENIRSFRGKAIFHSQHPIKCAGAPGKNRNAWPPTRFTHQWLASKRAISPLVSRPGIIFGVKCADTLLQWSTTAPDRLRFQRRLIAWIWPSPRRIRTWIAAKSRLAVRRIHVTHP